MVHGVAWVVAITLGLAVGGFVFHFPGSYGEPSWSIGAGLVGLVIGSINGLLVGALAWAALRLSRATVGAPGRDGRHRGRHPRPPWGVATMAVGVPTTLRARRSVTQPSDTLLLG